MKIPADVGEGDRPPRAQQAVLGCASAPLRLAGQRVPTPARSSRRSRAAGRRQRTRVRQSHHPEVLSRTVPAACTWAHPRCASRTPARRLARTLVAVSEELIPPDTPIPVGDRVRAGGGRGDRAEDIRVAWAWTIQRGGDRHTVHVLVAAQAISAPVDAGPIARRREPEARRSAADDPPERVVLAATRPTVRLLLIRASVAPARGRAPRGSSQNERSFSEGSHTEPCRGRSF